VIEGDLSKNKIASAEKSTKAAGEPRRSACIFRRTGVPVSARCSFVSFFAPHFVF
jgi:hypothetical protein